MLCNLSMNTLQTSSKSGNCPSPSCRPLRRHPRCWTKGSKSILVTEPPVAVWWKRDTDTLSFAEWKGAPRKDKWALDTGWDAGAVLGGWAGMAGGTHLTTADSSQAGFFWTCVSVRESFRVTPPHPPPIPGPWDPVVDQGGGERGVGPLPAPPVGWWQSPHPPLSPQTQGCKRTSRHVCPQGLCFPAVPYMLCKQSFHSVLLK